MNAMRSRPGRLVFTALALFSAGHVCADDPRSISTNKLDTSRGADVYSHVCQGCHMPLAQGAEGAGTYPKLAGNPALASWQYIAVIVLNGRKAMPPFGVPTGHQVTSSRLPLLTDAQIADVVNYVRSHFGNRYRDKVTAEQVAELPHPAAGMGF